MRRHSLLDLTADYIDRKERLKKLQGCDINIHKNDLMANVFVFVVLVGWCLYLLIGG
jgi:hypothetical protein